MSFKWLLQVLKGGGTKMLTSEKSNKHPIITQALKKKDIQAERFFLLQTTYLHESLEGLNSSLAQSDSELLPGAKCPQEWLLREQNFGQFLVYEP